jgi:hypothetical protein
MTYRHALLIVIAAIAILYLIPVVAGFPLWPGSSTKSLAQIHPHADDLMTFSAGYRPLRAFIAAELADGRLPLWMPYQMLGYPLLEQYEFQLLNPLEWPNWLGTDLWWSVVLVGQLSLAAGGVIAFCRKANVTPAGSAAAAILYSCAGFTSHLYLTASFVTAVPVIPWLFLFSWSTVSWTFTGLTVLGLITSTALMLLCGQPQITFCTLYFWVIFCAILYIPIRGTIRSTGALVVLGGSLALAILVVMPQVAPFAEFAISGERSNTHSLTHWFPEDGPRAFINLFNSVFPYSLGVSPYAVWTENRSIRPVAAEDMPISFYATGSFLVLLGLFSSRKSWVTVAVAGTFVAILATIVLHAYVGLRVWAPGFVNLPRYAMPLFAFLGAILAAVGIDNCHSLRAAIYAAVSVFALAGLVVAYLALSLTAGDVSNASVLYHVLTLNAVSLASLCGMITAVVLAPRERVSYALLLILIGDVLWQFRYGFALQHDLLRLAPWIFFVSAALLSVRSPKATGVAASAAVVSLLLLWAGHRVTMRAQTPPRPLPLDELRGHRAVAGIDELQPNHSAALRISTMSSRYPIQFRRLQERFSIRLTDFRGFGEHALPWWEYCQMRQTLASLSSDRLIAPKAEMEALASTDPECVKGLQLLFVADGIAIYRDELATPRAYIKRDATRVPVRVTDNSPLEIVVEVDGETGFLVLNDQYFPGWRAYINGAPVPIDRVDGVSRGVHLPATADTVEFVYAPALWPWAGLSGLGALGALLLACSAQRLRAFPRGNLAFREG